MLLVPWRPSSLTIPTLVLNARKIQPTISLEEGTVILLCSLKVRSSHSITLFAVSSVVPAVMPAVPAVVLAVLCCEAPTCCGACCVYCSTCSDACFFLDMKALFPADILDCFSFLRFLHDGIVEFFFSPLKDMMLSMAHRNTGFIIVCSFSVSSTNGIFILILVSSVEWWYEPMVASTVCQVWKWETVEAR